MAENRAGMLAALDVVAADVCGPNWRDDALDRAASILDRRERSRDELRGRIAARRKAEADAAPTLEAEQRSALDALLSQSTRTQEVGGHNAVCARIDAGALRAKYGGDGPVFPPAWDERRPKCTCCDWPAEEAPDAR